MLLPVTRRVAALLPASKRAAARSSCRARTAMATAAAPAPPPPLPPRCAHVILECDEPSLAAALARELSLPQGRVDELMRLGAVHFCLVPPPLQPGAPVDAKCGADGAARARAAALERWGAHSRLSSPRRVFSDLQPCPAHSFARVHLRPWRPADSSAAASSNSLRLLHASDSCVVVDKPPGLPVPPSVDNAIDCAAHLAAALLGEAYDDGVAAAPSGSRRWGRGVRARGVEEAAILDALESAASGKAAPRALRPVHRLDTGTSGVLVLARTQAFASWWAERQRARTAAGASLEEEDDDGGDEEQPLQQHATKLYRCLTLAPTPPPMGTHVHWAVTRYRPLDASGALPERTLMFASREEAERFLRESGPGARGERLLRRAGGNAAAVTPAAAKRCELEVLSTRRVGTRGWEALVELRTGRTHQIRAQMGALGCPLASDPLYGGGGGDSPSPSSLPLGLQAAELRVYDPEGRMGAEVAREDGWATFRAARPWWWGEGEGGKEESGG